jgi:hypothetical protein
MIKIAKEKMNNKDTIDSYNVIIHELKEQLEQKEFELKAADHVLAEKEKEIELLLMQLDVSLKNTKHWYNKANSQ